MLNTWPEIPWDTNLWKRLLKLCPKFFYISRVKVITSPEMLKVLEILSITTIKICSWMRRPKSMPEIRGKTSFLELIKKLVISSYLLEAINFRIVTYRAAVFSHKLFANILKYSRSYFRCFLHQHKSSMKKMCPLKKEKLCSFILENEKMCPFFS